MLSTVASETALCKCCGSTAHLCGVVDFNKNCEQQRNPHVLPVIGIPVYYHRCSFCGFIFSILFDDFSSHQFSEAIYNNDYILVDPDFEDVRPRSNAQAITNILGKNWSLDVLDYGGGTGKTAALLREQGYSNVNTYDPFSGEHRNRPQAVFDCIFSFEVFEHTISPRQTLDEICGLLKPNGLIFFSTLLQPENIGEVGLNWWYIGPRNGHVSIHTSQSLQALAQSRDLQLAHFSSGFHLLFREIPDWAKPILKFDQ